MNCIIKFTWPTSHKKINDSTYMRNPEWSNSEAGRRRVVARAGEGEMMSYRDRVPVLQDEKVLEKNGGDGCITR